MTPARGGVRCGGEPGVVKRLLLLGGLSTLVEGCMRPRVQLRRGNRENKLSLWKASVSWGE